MGLQSGATRHLGHPVALASLSRVQTSCPAYSALAEPFHRPGGLRPGVTQLEGIKNGVRPQWLQEEGRGQEAQPQW